MRDAERSLMQRTISRRTFLKGSGGLVVTFSLAACSPFGGDDNGATPTQTRQEVTGANVPGSTVTPVGDTERRLSTPGTVTGDVSGTPSPGAVASPATPETDAANDVGSWLAIAPDGSVTVFVGKVELGTGVRTSLAQIVAEELDVPFDRITMVMGDTAKTQDQGYTAGSKTLQVAGPVLWSAAATARQKLLELAAERLNVAVDQLTVTDGIVGAPGGESVTYGELVDGQELNMAISKDIQTQRPNEFTIVGTSVPRVDIPGKLTGAPSYVHDIVVEGMLHARVIRPWVRTPDGVLATIDSVDEGSVGDIPGARVVRDGNFLAVVAEREYDAIRAAGQLRVNWKQSGDNLPSMEALFTSLREIDSEPKELINQGNVDDALGGAATTLEATYNYPFQAHASMGPSCAVADIREDSGVVWSSTQGVYPLRDAIAAMLGMAPESLQVIHVEGAGCYGQNGFDDAAADAAVISRATGRPVRLQWMRQDEFAWEPKGPAMTIDVRGGLDDGGGVVGWRFESWTPTHSTRPGGEAGNLLAGLLIEDAADPADNRFVGGDRNAPTLYQFTNHSVVVNALTTSALRQSALRTLGAVANTYANECFIDELASAAGADPVEFRLRYLNDPRAVDVVTRVAQRAGWQARPSPQTTTPSGVVSGRGIAFAQYETEFTYVAAVAEVDVDTATGQVSVRRVVVAHDCGLIVNPDGVTNQIEGNAIQTTSRALKEQVTFDATRVTSLDWASYPIITFPEIPAVEVELIDRPDQPSLGAGEPAAVPIPAAIGNAIFDATGARVRQVPMTPDLVLTALGGG